MRAAVGMGAAAASCEDAAVDMVFNDADEELREAAIAYYKALDSTERARLLR